MLLFLCLFFFVYVYVGLMTQIVYQEPINGTDRISLSQ